MGWDIYIKNARGEVVHFGEYHQLRGGTYAVGGTKEAWLTVTYNYSTFYYKTIDKDQGLRWLHGKPVPDTLSVLECAYEQLRGDADADYWATTEGNAKAALKNIIELGKMSKTLPGYKKFTWYIS